MTIPLIATFGQTVFMLLLGFVAIFLILLVLVQRGRGGGLAGALGGMGGSSAFGAKAGDVFTKVTVVAATVWIVLCIAATKMTPSEESLINTNVSGPLPTASEGPALGAPANDAAEDDSVGDVPLGDVSVDGGSVDGDSVGGDASAATGGGEAEPSSSAESE